MQLQKLSYSILFFFVSCLLLSCDRDLVTDIVSRTPPSLEVLVRDASLTPIPGATVNLYKDQPTWNAEGTPAASKTTDAQGRVVFDEEELGTPGVFYLVSTDGTRKTKTQTKYLLLTDGSTLVTVTLN